MRLLPVSAFAVLLLLSAAASADDDKKLYRWKDADGVVHYTDTPPPDDRTFETRDVTRDPPQPPAVVEPPPPPLSRCDQARRNLAVFESNQNVSMDLDGDGTAEPLDAEARERERTKTQELVAENCKDGTDGQGGTDTPDAG